MIVFHGPDNANILPLERFQAGLGLNGERAWRDGGKRSNFFFGAR
jgi:hypothetical protein